MERDHPAQIAQYRIEGILGEGGFGIVYRAWDTLLETHVALKLPKLDDVEESQADRIIARFIREARAAARLPPHSNLCPVREIGKFEDLHYAVMAFIQGVPLSRAIRPVHVEHAVRLVRKIAKAMQVAHDHGVVHRDLKPSNIMLVDGHQPVVMDFGLALRIDVEESEKTTQGRVMGTPAYMSLEQIDGKTQEIGPQSDVYSLGVILYELLTGHVPYQGTLVQMVGQIIQGNPDFPIEARQRIPTEVIDVCLKAMSRDAENRFQRMTDFALALTNCLSRVVTQGDTTMGRPPATIPGAPPFSDTDSTPRSGSAEETIKSPGPNVSPFNANEASESQKNWARYLAEHVRLVNSLEMQFVLIPPCEFTIGSRDSEQLRGDDEPIRRVRLTEPYYLSVYPVTQRQFTQVMGINPSEFEETRMGFETSHLPVERVSWFDCLEFCNKLSARDGRPPYYSLTRVKLDENDFIKSANVEVLGGIGYRLPTEAEWECGCRAGTETCTPYGDMLSSSQANFNGLFPYGEAAQGPNLRAPCPVGSFAENAFGLHDTIGNVWEWCWDGYREDAYRKVTVENPVIPPETSGRVIRGGSWRDHGGASPNGGQCRSATRNQCLPMVRLGVIGFRVAVTARK